MAATPLSVFTVRKRSLGQGKIFTSTCHSVHRGGVHAGEVCVRGGGGMHALRASMPRGVCVPRGHA